MTVAIKTISILVCQLGLELLQSEGNLDNERLGLFENLYRDEWFTIILKPYLTSMIYFK